MSDKKYFLELPVGSDNTVNGAQIKLKDMGDNTFAPVVVASIINGTLIEGDGANAALGATTDAAVSTDAAGTLSAKLRGLIKILADVWVSGSHWIKTQIQASENFIGKIGGVSITIGDETARVSDGNAYAAGDAIGATVSDTGTTVLRALAVGRAAAAQNSGWLTKFRLMTDQVACTARIRVHYYTLAAPTGPIVGDNVQMTILYTNKAQRIGHIDLPAFTTSTVTGSSTAAYSQDIDTRLKFCCASGDANIYYRLETLDGFTPASGQKFYHEVTADLD